MSTPQLPALKPGNQATEFKGKVAMQIILGILAVCNAVLAEFGKPEIILDAETAALLAVSFEGLWMLWRQGNKQVEIKGQTEVTLAKLNAEVEALRAAANPTDDMEIKP